MSVLANILPPTTAPVAALGRLGLLQHCYNFGELVAIGVASCLISQLARDW